MEISHYNTQIVGAALTFLVSYVIWRFQKEKLKLNYFVTETESFDANNMYLKFYTIKIINAGNRLIESINADISFSDGKIDRISDDRLISDLNQSDDNINFNVSHLNKKESVNFTITIRESKKGTSKPTISIRGKGATASDKTASQSKSGKSGDYFAYGFLTGLVLFVGLDYIATSTTKPQPDRIENVFSILNKSRLSYLFPQMVKSNDDMSYVGTAFFLTHSYLKDSTNHKKYINALKLLSQIDDISDNSKGVVYYLIFKINKKEKNLAEAEEYLQKCKNETSFIYQQLMDQDPYYDLDSLKNI